MVIGVVKVCYQNSALICFVESSVFENLVAVHLHCKCGQLMTTWYQPILVIINWRH